MRQPEEEQEQVHRTGKCNEHHPSSGVPYNVAIKLLYVHVPSRSAVVSSNQRSAAACSAACFMVMLLWGAFCARYSGYAFGARES